MPVVHRAGHRVVLSVRKGADQPPPVPLNAAEKRLAKIIRDAIRRLEVRADSDALMAALDRGDVSAALAALDFPDFIGQFSEVQGEMGRQIASAATEYARELGVDGTFNRVDPNVVAAANAQVGHLLTHVSANTQAAVRHIVTTGIASQQLTPRDMSNIIRKVVGLTPQQADAIVRARMKYYSALLKDGVPPGKAEKMADEFAARRHAAAVKSRAVTIARTEVSRSNNSGRVMTWREGAAQGLVTPGHRKEWVATHPGNRHGPPCPTCAPLDGMTVPWDSDFPGVGEMPPAHPRCRCTVVLRRPERRSPPALPTNPG